MAADESIQPHGRSGPDGTTESSPLLGSSGDASYGASTVPSSSATAMGDDVEVMNGSSATVGNGGAGVAREGLPEMAQKMHFLLPAIGIGIFLSALDQTVIVATYARMSSDLEALNRTSWISTA